jgi:hypothetical protein
MAFAPPAATERVDCGVENESVPAEGITCTERRDLASPHEIIFAVTPVASVVRNHADAVKSLA